MAKLRFAQFSGEIPRLLSRLLPETGAQHAENVRLGHAHPVCYCDECITDRVIIAAAVLCAILAGLSTFICMDERKPPLTVLWGVTAVTFAALSISFFCML